MSAETNMKKSQDNASAGSTQAAESKESTKSATLSELFQFADTGDWILMGIGTLGGMVTGASLPIFCILFGKMLDSLNKGTSLKEAVDFTCILFVIVAGCNIISGLMQVMGWSISGERQAQKLREKYVESILRQEVGWFDTCGASKLNTLVSELTGKVQEGISHKVGDIVQNLTQFLFSFIAAFYLNWNLTVVLLAAFPIIAAAGTFLIRAVTASQNETANQYARAGGLATQSISSIRTVTALNIQPQIIDEYRTLIVDAMNISLVKFWKVGISNGITFCVSFMTYALGFWYGAHLLASQRDHGCTSHCLTGGKIMAVFFCVIVGSSGLGQLAPPMSAFYSAKAAAKEMIEIIERKPKIDGFSDEGLKPTERPHGAIDLVDVNFSYPSRPDVTVCKGYSLRINPGETVALCGPSGAGKSTLINLLQRFYDPDSGSIVLDGHDIKALNLRWLREQMGYVGQEPVLFAGTIHENIACAIEHEIGANQLSHEDVRKRVVEAAQLANAHTFIQAFPAGYDTVIGGHGHSLSGGQKQRIAIARALIKKPAVLLLDEATSALDAASEKLVQESIDKLQQNHAQTTIVIAHRLSTIRNADKIAVISDGRVVELGKHDELVKKNGVYADLIRLQMTEDDVERSEESAGRDVVDKEESGKEGNNQQGAPRKRTVSGTKSDIETGNAKEVQTTKEADATEVDASKYKVFYWKLWAEAWPYLPWLVLGLIGSLMVGGSFPVWGLLMAKTQNMFYYQDTDKLRRVSVLVAERFIMLGIDCLIGYTLQYYCIAQVSQRVTTVLRSRMFEALMKRDVGFFDFERNSVGNLTSQLADDARLVNDATGERLSNQLQAIFTLTVGLVIGFTASWRITLVVMATFPLNIAASAIKMKSRTGQHFASDSDDESSSGQSSISSAFTHMRTISAFSMQHRISEQYRDETRLVSKARQMRSGYNGIALGLSNAVMFLCYALLFWYGSRLISDGHLTFERMMTAIMGLMLGALGLGQALNDIGDQKEGLDAAGRIFEAIEAGEKSPINGLSNVGDRSDSSLTGKIEFKGLKFHYPTRPEVQVCNDYNLTIEPGEVVALVGPSGGGKSTIMNLLLRFYDPLEGDILVDGKPIKSFNVRWLRSQIGYVGQEPVLFTGSVSSNIAKGRRDTENSSITPLQTILSQHSVSKSLIDYFGSLFNSRKAYSKANSNEHAEAAAGDIEIGKVSADSDVIEAATLANAHEFIQAFPAGYDTDVGEGSVMVSGGQKQRIAIARALIKKPAVLLLDEATSALDAASEKLVQESIDKLQQNHAQTTIVIAHRLSTICNADKIAVISDGRVVELGKHDELVKKNGVYAQLWAKQSGAK